MNIILIDSSYTSFYRFFATLRWFSFAHKEQWKELKDDKTYDWSMNEIFMKTYEKMYLESIKKLLGAKVFKQSIICFCQDDLRGTLWRNKLAKDYKECRVDLRDKNDFTNVFKYTYEKIIPNLVKDNDKILSFRIDNVEADDIIAVISDLTKDMDLNVFIVSADDDFTQLGRKNLTIINYKDKKQKNLSEKESKKLLYNKIVTGDKSDNIPSIFKGVKISNKEKKELIEDENKLKEYMKNNKKIKERFETNQKMIDFSYMPKPIRKKIMYSLEKQLFPKIKN